jgi:hypothetical protein
VMVAISSIHNFHGVSIQCYCCWWWCRRCHVMPESGVNSGRTKPWGWGFGGEGDAPVLCCSPCGTSRQSCMHASSCHQAGHIWQYCSGYSSRTHGRVGAGEEGRQWWQMAEFRWGGGCWRGRGGGGGAGRGISRQGRQSLNCPVSSLLETAGQLITAGRLGSDHNCARDGVDAEACLVYDPCNNTHVPLRERGGCDSPSEQLLENDEVAVRPVQGECSAPWVAPVGLTSARPQLAGHLWRGGGAGKRAQQEELTDGGIHN